jgi:hypothetical protein
MKLLVYTIGGQKIGIDIQTWDESMLSGNTAFMAIADTGSTPTDYVDISTIIYWDQFGGFTTLTPVEIKEEITKLIPDTPTPEEITVFIDWGIFIDTTILSGETASFWGDLRIEGKLWVETIRRVKQETNQMIIRVEQENALGGGNIAGMIILDPTGSTTGWTTGDTMPYYIVGVDKDGVLVAGWSGDTQPVVRGSSSGVYGAEFQIASALAETTTTSITPQTKVTLTTTNLPSGTYKIFVAWLAGSSSAQQDMIFDVTLNGTPQGTNPTMNIESKDTNTTNTLSRTFYLPLSGVNDIVLRYSSEGGNTTSISDATIELIRVE